MPAELLAPVRDLWAAQEDDAPLEPPPGFPGTAPEYSIYAALFRMVQKGQISDFEFQSPEQGGRYERGGSILDFFLPDFMLGINIQSSYWHYGRPGKMDSDAMRAASLAMLGIDVVFIDEADALDRPTFYIEEAIAGVDHSAMTRWS